MTIETQYYTVYAQTGSNLPDGYDRDSLPYNSYSVQSVQGSYTGSNNPGWHTKIAQHANAGSAYQRAAFNEITVGQWTQDYRYTDWVTWLPKCGRISSPFLPARAFPLGFFPSAPCVQEASDNVRRQIRGASKDINILVPVAELGELRGTILNAMKIATDTASVLVDISKGRLPRTRLTNLHGKRVTLSQYASDAWLTYSFGISPFVSDINSISDAISAQLRPQGGHTMHFAATASTDYSTSAPGLLGTGGFGNSGKPPCIVITSNTISARCVAGYYFPALLSANNYGAIFNHYGLSINSLPSVAWELLPYSWMVDYFTNVGQFLSDAFEAPSGNTVYFCTTIKYDWEYSCRVTEELGSYPGPNYAHSILENSESSSDAMSSGWSINRSVGGALPVPRLRFKSSHEIGRSAERKLLNVLSILGKR